jgi:adenylylsulfate kinase
MDKEKSSNVTWHQGKVGRKDRFEAIGNNKGNKVIWFTGLSGSGKSTIAAQLEKKLLDNGTVGYILDGDNIRHGLNSDLGFSDEDRKENIRRIAEVTKLFYDSGQHVLVCFISPFRSEREFARNLIGKDFVEVYVKCPIEECKKRDPKGLYKKAIKGEIKDFTGIDSPFEEPKHAEIILDTSKYSVDECVDKIIPYIL